MIALYGVTPPKAKRLNRSPQGLKGWAFSGAPEQGTQKQTAGRSTLWSLSLNPFV